MSNQFKVLGPHSAEEPITTEFQEFEKWWKGYAETLNQRATLVWQELAWSGWFARSEIADGGQPTVFPRWGPDE